MIKMSNAPANHSPRISAITPPRSPRIAARNAAPHAIRIANIATTPQRAGVKPGGAPHDGQTRSGPSYPLLQRAQIGISLRYGLNDSSSARRAEAPIATETRTRRSLHGVGSLPQPS